MCPLAAPPPKKNMKNTAFEVKSVVSLSPVSPTKMQISLPISFLNCYFPLSFFIPARSGKEQTY